MVVTVVDVLDYGVTVVRVSSLRFKLRVTIFVFISCKMSQKRRYWDMVI